MRHVDTIKYRDFVVLVFSVTGGALGIVGYVKSKTTTTSTAVYSEKKAFDLGPEHLYIQAELAGLSSKSYVAGELLLINVFFSITVICAQPC